LRYSRNFAPLVAELKNWDQLGAISSIPTTLFVRMLIRSNDKIDAPYPNR
jgi:hypothetical protein